jgi:hypothetical protein
MKIRNSAPDPGILYLSRCYKAVDRLHYCKLFKLLVKRDLPAQIVTVFVS